MSLIGDGWAFDEFGFTRLDQINPVVPNWSATAKTSLVSNALKVESAEWGGEAKLAMAGDDDYLAQADIQLNSGADGQLMFRYTDPDNYYALRLDDGGGVTLVKVVRGKESTVASNSYTPDTSVTAKVSVSGSTIKAWVGGSLKINTTDSALSGGTVALAGEKAIFDNVAVGYDNNADDTIDYYVINETFGGTSVTPTHDHAGNLTYDGTYRYTYDAWNRLVKATLNDTNVEVQAAVYDGLGRRVKKVVTNSGTHDGTTWYYCNRNQIVEAHDGNGKLINQVYHAERARGGSVKEYIDEIVAMRTECGRVYVHQAEGDQCGSLKDWNVIGLTDITSRSLERYYYSPYGELEVVRDVHFFDYDDDGDVDDDETAFTACISETSGDCLRFDADCDGEVTEVDDGEEFGYYTATLTADTELQRIPATTSGSLGNPFGHQGLAFDAEIGSYQNRARQYAPKMKRFMQRDPLMSIADSTASYADGLSQYTYSRSSSSALRDPTGLQTCAQLHLFVKGGSCGPVGSSHFFGCTRCNGNHDAVACLNPADYAGYPTDAEGNCERYPDYHAVDRYAMCVCEHEHTHKDGITKGRTCNATGRNGCDAVTGVGFPICCNDCYLNDSETEALQAHLRCVERYVDDSDPNKQSKRTFLENAIQNSKQLAKQCANNHPCRFSDCF